MHYVYLLQSEQYPEETHIGYTENVQARLAAHNNGESIHTTEHKPWTLVGYMCFKDKVAAMIFETFLKSGEGKTLTKKYFWNTAD